MYWIISIISISAHVECMFALTWVDSSDTSLHLEIVSHIFSEIKNVQVKRFSFYRLYIVYTKSNFTHCILLENGAI